MSYFFPDSSGFVQLAARSHCVLYFVHMSIPLAKIEFTFISGINTINFKKRSFVLLLVSEDSAHSQQKIALEHNFPGVFAIFEVLFPACPPCSRVAERDRSLVSLHGNNFKYRRGCILKSMFSAHSSCSVPFGSCNHCGQFVFALPAALCMQNPLTEVFFVCLVF